MVSLHAREEAGMQTETKLLDADALREAEIPEAFWTYSVDTYIGSPTALKECDKFARQWKRASRNPLGLLIRGGPDSQKTFLAVYAALCVMLKGGKVRYVSLPDLVDKILRNEIRLREFIVEPDLLVLDNVNANITTFWPQALNRVLVARKDEGRGTIIVTQIPNDIEFAQVYGKGNQSLVNTLCVTVEAHADATKQQLIAHRRKAALADEV
jgi:DNA replication protein DnaC